MAKMPSKTADIVIGTTSFEEFTTDISQEVTQALPVTTCFADAGPRRVAGNYDFGYSLAGVADFAAAASDIVLHALVGATGAHSLFDPTGTSAAGDNPNYDTTSGVLLESYNIQVGVGEAVTYDATLKGTAALARNV